MTHNQFLNSLWCQQYEEEKLRRPHPGLSPWVDVRGGVLGGAMAVHQAETQFYVNGFPAVILLCPLR